MSNEVIKSKFNIKRFGINFYDDNKNIESDCNEIMIFNNGTADVRVSVNKTQGYQVISPNTGKSYSNESLGKEVSNFQIRFVGAGTKDVYFERAYYSPCD